MSIDPQKVRSLFLQAVERCEPGQWDSFLETACGDDLPLRDRVAAMLAAHLGEDSVLDVEANLYAPTIDRLPECVPGDQIGPYKLLQPIGEGGMGSVWMAEQHEPVRRRVAMKLIKPGMDSRQVLARFEAERQALSMMDHPNIAKVLDAGTTEGGRPYFVMELVKAGERSEKYLNELAHPVPAVGRLLRGSRPPKQHDRPNQTYLQMSLRI